MCQLQNSRDVHRDESMDALQSVHAAVGLIESCMETLTAMVRHKHDLQLPQSRRRLVHMKFKSQKDLSNRSAVFVKHKNLGFHAFFPFFDARLLHHLYYPSWRDACIIQVLNAFSDGSKSVILSEIFIPFRFLSGFFFFFFVLVLR